MQGTITELAMAGAHARFVSLMQARVALKRFAKRAGPRLDFSHALAAGAAAERAAQHVERVGRGRAVLARVENVQRWRRGNRRRFQLAHCARQPADVMPVALEHRRRRVRAMTAVADKRLGA